ncbi:MBOAT family O-acyltransferase [Cerasicoccus arenae]|uniref:Alginate O-acetylation protein n=1 Tax=Cerasicoccus arenae TaxID=424488 RepID=A0A8J3DCC6_9BACT|nr:MBOAT family protein [Cerasicoccus arenae]MBK1858940.1 MBOAT family protein [Cerasicoccus arenae]GHC03976.1 alginate O-acetylation protein [Cerasicoccus arenae]
MLFNSYEFILAFLPLVVIGYYLLARFAAVEMAQAWLIAASLFYYGWWNPVYLVLILGSVLFNYWISGIIGRFTRARIPNLPLLIVGIVVNIALLAYFKYANFFVDNINATLDVGWTLSEVILPLAISFFTFQQIAFLVDVYEDNAPLYEFREYLLFIIFFPQLVAGPIVHHKEMMPQFEEKKTYHLKWENIAVGLTFFTFGLFKKVIIADTLGIRASEAFGAAADGLPLYAWEAWAGALAYTLQIYFDFSGYTDMAIGLALLFGIRIPLNFNSPYQAHSIIEFWRRWHMTLSRFLRDYVYITLGGNRHGKLLRDVNIMATMFIGGLWHGAGWTFVLWGMAHGVLLLINHHFAEFRKKLSIAKSPSDAKFSLGKILGVALTFLCVVLTWVLFRADGFSAATYFYQAMLGQQAGDHVQLFKPQIFAFIAVLVAFCWACPNLQRILANHFQPPDGDCADPVEPARIAWHPTVRWALLTAIVFLTAFLSLSSRSEFLYYQF